MFYALSAAVLWGAIYVMYEAVLKTLSPPSVLFLTFAGTALMFSAWALVSDTFAQDWQVLKRWGSEAKLLAVMTLLGVLANLCFLGSMRLKNATLAGMVEISYPLFTALFAWMFFREVQMTWGAFFGMLLIMAGVACIFYFEKA